MGEGPGHQVLTFSGDPGLGDSWALLPSWAQPSCTLPTTMGSARGHRMNCPPQPEGLHLPPPSPPTMELCPSVGERDLRAQESTCCLGTLPLGVPTMH